MSAAAFSGATAAPPCSRSPWRLDSPRLDVVRHLGTRGRCLGARPVIQPAAGLEVAGLRLAAVVAPCLSGLAGRLVDLDGGDVCTARDGPGCRVRACSWWWCWSGPQDGNEKSRVKHHIDACTLRLALGSYFIWVPTSSVVRPCACAAGGAACGRAAEAVATQAPRGGISGY